MSDINPRKMSHINPRKMSDTNNNNIPFDTQMEIIKKVSDVKSLIQFRSVSKPWKSFIDNSQFIRSYAARHTQPHSFILSYKVCQTAHDVRYTRLVLKEDLHETFKVEQHELAPAVVSPLIKQSPSTKIVGVCHGLVCYLDACYHKSLKKSMLVIWNPSIRKSFAIFVHRDLWIPENYKYGFGVRPDTSDPIVVKIIEADNKPWHVEVFTLSSGVWNVITCSNLLTQSIELTPASSNVVIDRFIYWDAYDTGDDYDEFMVVSFDLIKHEFKLVDLPDCLKYKSYGRLRVSVSKLRESLVVYGSFYVEGLKSCDVWVMQHDSSFEKLFSIRAEVGKILGFSESGKPIFQKKKYREFSTLDVYDPCSQQISNLEIVGGSGTFGMGSYKESLLLLDHPDLHIYCNDN